MPASTPATECPCGSTRSYSACCGRYHGGETANTAEVLMRSRYSAYVRGDADYLLATWHSSTRPDTLALQEEPPRQWLGLDIRRTGSEGELAIVEFVARFKINGRAFRLHETSYFVQEGGRWFYRDGLLHER